MARNDSAKPSHWGWRKAIQRIPPASGVQPDQLNRLAVLREWKDEDKERQGRSVLGVSKG
jgi:hypothetical protein